MSTQLQLRRGTTAQHSTFTGASGEITIDTDKKTVVVHDGITPGGRALSQFDPSRSNRIINGAMMIDQRNAGASVVNSAGSTYFIDRWTIYDGSGGSHFTVQRNKDSVTPPAGYTNYLGIQTTTALSAAAGNNLTLTQYIEGFNTSDLGWGAVGAASVTVSFWVRSSLTGTFAGQLQSGNNDATYVFNYTINSANTWEQKTITIAGPTIGMWYAGTNNRSIACRFDLGCGSTFAGTANTWSASTLLTTSGAVALVGTLNATFYITGVQLEKGSVATPFEFRPYGTELALCQRYYQPIYGFIRGASSSAIGSTGFTKVAMRAAPTLAGTAYQGTSFVLGAGIADTTGSWYVQATSAVNGIVEYSGTASAEL